MLIDKKSPHGGDIYSRKVRLDFSANINPMGMPEPVKDALINSARNCSVYPDPYCTRLRNKLAEYEGVTDNMILCGNGAAELIYAFSYSLPDSLPYTAAKDRPALIISPAFCEYQASLRAAGIKAEHYILSENDGFRLTEDILRTDFSRFCAVFLCSPGNPTGVTADPDIARAIARTGVRMLLDLSLLDLTDTPDMYDIPLLAREFPNIAILRAFTKNFALAGVRLGYVICYDSRFLEIMSEKTQCWNVSVPAQEAGCAAADCREWLRTSVAVISSERHRMSRELRSLGLRVYDGEADYLLMYSEEDLYEKLLGTGILVRDCSGYEGLRKGYIRAAIHTREENDQLLQAIREILT